MHTLPRIILFHLDHWNATQRMEMIFRVCNELTMSIHTYTYTIKYERIHLALNPFCHMILMLCLPPSYRQLYILQYNIYIYILCIYYIICVYMWWWCILCIVPRFIYEVEPHRPFNYTNVAANHSAQMRMSLPLESSSLSSCCLDAYNDSICVYKYICSHIVLLTQCQCLYNVYCSYYIIVWTQEIVFVHIKKLYIHFDWGRVDCAWSIWPTIIIRNRRMYFNKQQSSQSTKYRKDLYSSTILVLETLCSTLDILNNIFHRNN